MFSDVVKVVVIIVIAWEFIYVVLGAKLGCSRQQEPHLWIQREDRCYDKRIREFVRRYDPGRNYCLGQCSDYATPNSEEENDWILSLYKEMYPVEEDLWLSCNNTSGDWVCLGDTKEMKYRNWEQGFSAIGYTTCAYMDGARGTWGVAQSCENNWKWTMCEAPAQPPISPLKVRCNAVAIPSGKCPKPVITFNGITPMQCCLTCAKQCNCRSFSLTPGTQDCNINPDKINDPNPTLINQTL